MRRGISHPLLRLGFDYAQPAPSSLNRVEFRDLGFYSISLNPKWTFRIRSSSGAFFRSLSIVETQEKGEAVRVICPILCQRIRIDPTSVFLVQPALRSYFKFRT